MFEMDEVNNVTITMRFPQKLWWIIHNCKSGAIWWGESGSTILLDYKKFHEEYLIPENCIFKTTNITSFIRQLNLYGFRKVTPHSRNTICNTYNVNVHEFLHENFRNGHYDLVSKICRKSGSRNYGKYCIKQSTKYSDQDICAMDTCAMTKLRGCQLALKEALKQASVQYQAQKLKLKLEEGTQYLYEEFQFYYNKSKDASNEVWENTTVFVPKITNTTNREWYSEVLHTIMTNKASL